MIPSLQQRAKDAFADDDREAAQKFLDDLLLSLDRASSSVTRTVVAIFLLAGVFELLVTSTTIKSVTIGSLSVSNTSLIQKAIPALVAYLIYDTYCLAKRYQDIGVIYLAILKRFRTRIYDSELTRLLVPRIRGPWGFGLLPGRKYFSSADNFDYRITSTVAVVAFLVFPLAFEAQAYYELVHRYGLQDILVWISAAASAFFIIAWIVTMIFAISDQTRFDW